MVLFNYALKELTAKIVYYGPGLSGKTTNLKYIHQELPDESKGRMLSLATETDRTLYFDFLPVEAGVVRGIKTRIQLYTVPGQVFYNATRRMVLKGADGIVFVADSQRSAMAANLQSWESLEENLAAHDLNADGIPIVLQYNKRDLDDVHSVEEMNDTLNKINAPFYEAIAHDGIGVQDTLQAISGLVLRKVIAKYGGDEPSGEISLGMSTPAGKITDLAKPLPFERRSERPSPSTEPQGDEAMESLTAELDQLISGGGADADVHAGSLTPDGAAPTTPTLAAETSRDQPMGQTTDDSGTALDEINLEGILDEALRSDDEPIPKEQPPEEGDAFSFPDLLEDALGDEADSAEQILDFAETAREATTGRSAASVGLASAPPTVPSVSDAELAQENRPTQVPSTPSSDHSVAAPSEPLPPALDPRLAELSQTQMYDSGLHARSSLREAARTSLDVEGPESGDASLDPGLLESAKTALDVRLPASAETSRPEAKSVEVPITLELPADGQEVELQIVLNVRLSRTKK